MMKIPPQAVYYPLYFLPSEAEASKSWLRSQEVRKK